MSWFLKGVEALTSVTATALQEAQNIGSSLVDKITEVEGESNTNNNKNNMIHQQEQQRNGETKTSISGPSSYVTNVAPKQNNSTFNLWTDDDDDDVTTETKPKQQFQNISRDEQQSSPNSKPVVLQKTSTTTVAPVGGIQKKSFVPGKSGNVKSNASKPIIVVNLGDAAQITEIESKNEDSSAIAKPVSDVAKSAQLELSNNNNKNLFSQFLFDLGGDENDENEDDKKATDSTETDKLREPTNEQQTGWNVHPSIWNSTTASSDKLTNDCTKDSGENKSKSKNIVEGNDQQNEQSRSQQYTSALFSAFEIGAGAILSTLDKANQALERANQSEYQKICALMNTKKKNKENNQHDLNYEIFAKEIRSHLTSSNNNHHDDRAQRKCEPRKLHDRSTLSSDLKAIFTFNDHHHKPQCNPPSSSSSAFRRLETLQQDFNSEVSSAVCAFLRQKNRSSLSISSQFEQTLKSLETSSSIASLKEFVVTNWCETVTDEIQIFIDLVLVGLNNNNNNNVTTNLGIIESSSRNNQENFSSLILDFCRFSVKLLEEETFLRTISSGVMSSVEEELMSLLQSAKQLHDDDDDQGNNGNQDGAEENSTILSLDEAEEYVFEVATQVRRECFQLIAMACFVVEQTVAGKMSQAMSKIDEAKEEASTKKLHDGKDENTLTAVTSAATKIATRPKAFVFQAPAKKSQLKTLATVESKIEPDSDAKKFFEEAIATSTPVRIEETKTIANSSVEKALDQKPASAPSKMDQLQCNNDDITVTSTLVKTPVSQQENRLKKGKGFSLKK